MGQLPGMGSLEPQNLSLAGPGWGSQPTFARVTALLPLRGRLRAPCFVSQRYLDGELAMWRADFVSPSTITISAFAGEYDICPKDGAAAFLTFQIADCILHISKMNMCRILYIFHPPTRQVSYLQVAKAMSPLQQPSCPDCHLSLQVINNFYIQGYQDTISFLKRLSK